jgi:hypothetical protein
MQNDKMEKNSIKILRKKNESTRVTRPTRHSRHENMIKKKTFKRRTYKKRLKLNKKMSMKMLANSG